MTDELPTWAEAEAMRGEIARLRQENAELKEELGGYALPQFWGYCPTDDYPDWDQMPEGPEKDRLAAEGSQRFIDRMKADWFRQHTFQKQRADALRAQLAAIKPYVQHKFFCEAIQAPIIPARRCDCGLSKLLSQGTSEAERT